MEISVSYGTRSSSIDSNNYTKSESITGSFAWYFLEMSAVEISYTKGIGEQSLMAPTDPAPTYYYQDMEMLGLDLIYTIGSRDSLLQPFLRGGAAHLLKKLYKTTSDGTTTQYGDTVNAIVPSVGVGLNIHLTESFAIKGSYDRWESGTVGDSGIWDDAFKVGASWYF